MEPHPIKNHDKASGWLWGYNEIASDNYGNIYSFCRFHGSSQTYYVKHDLKKIGLGSISTSFFDWLEFHFKYIQHDEADVWAKEKFNALEKSIDENSQRRNLIFPKKKGLLARLFDI
ncbi:MAG: hypothetical protein K9J37_20490 [Saprospiraceae bacterium]|nr:hypothetical protein [Saprospiraceae bacterium]MCF8252304.1 hypothetical protein [Saprospiraceae bacterium]MCF8282166.1 hypothetical protein [Bacteroidales bacterium]MCF8313946.1 hypothetical protein [Saprospiraceae bacterium]MCF8442656.1 hypothetical protein [Saprospiraceae bacterium]